MRLILALSLTLLAACGADGPPVPPSQSTAQPTPGLTGTLKVGIAGG